jgi:DNA topoisomerase I
LRDLGEHPDGGKVQVFSGKYGAYVKHDKTNATIPSDNTAEAITLEQALVLITEREAKSGGKKKPAKKAAAKKVAPKKKAAAKKKAPAKKAAKSPRAKKTETAA